jgi:ribosomal protein L40E
LKELNISSYLQKYTIAYRSQYRQIRIVEIYPMTPFLAPDEQLAWYNMKTSGIFTKKVDWVQALTSFRVLEYNFKSHQSTSLPLSLVDNTIVTNRRTVSQTSQNGLFVGSGSNAAVIQGSAKSTSVTVGDVIFTQSGKNYMTFSQVQDPDGVADVFQSTKSVILSEEEYHQHMNPNITLPPNPNTAGLICSKCDGSNPEDAIFCNKCGSKISTSCVSCGARNPSDSTFCNKCGVKF